MGVVATTRPGLPNESRPSQRPQPPFQPTYGPIKGGAQVISQHITKWNTTHFHTLSITLVVWRK